MDHTGSRNTGRRVRRSMDRTGSRSMDHRARRNTVRRGRSRRSQDDNPGNAFRSSDPPSVRRPNRSTGRSRRRSTGRNRTSRRDGQTRAPARTHNSRPRLPAGRSPAPVRSYVGSCLHVSFCARPKAHWSSRSAAPLKMPPPTGPAHGVPAAQPEKGGALHKKCLSPAFKTGCGIGPRTRYRQKNRKNRDNRYDRSPCKSLPTLPFAERRPDPRMELRHARRLP